MVFTVPVTEGVNMSILAIQVYGLGFIATGCYCVYRAWTGAV